MYRAEIEATATAPTPPIGNQVLASRAAGVAGTAPSDAANIQPEPTCDGEGFLLILLRALSAWGT
jgi:hypothetical protein